MRAFIIKNINLILVAGICVFIRDMQGKGSEK